MPDMRDWVITVRGGPAFAFNAASACRLAAKGREPGPIRECLERLAEALFQADKDSRTEVVCAGGVEVSAIGASSG